jgi:hypothetical protein
MKILYKLGKKLGIIARCPNCESAWTGGVADPFAETHCIVCGDKDGKITGWVWGRVVDPFYWLGRRNVRRNLNRILSRTTPNRKNTIPLPRTF